MSFSSPYTVIYWRHKRNWDTNGTNVIYVEEFYLLLRESFLHNMRAPLAKMYVYKSNSLSDASLFPYKDSPKMELWEKGGKEYSWKFVA